MSGREWLPGDVGLVPFSAETVVGLRVEGGWITKRNSSPISAYTAVRPLVVIDPEDREQVERLGQALLSNGVLTNFGLTPGNIAAALREFANPTPPRPDEPQGLGAVVETARGNRYVRAGDGWLPETVLGQFRNPIAWEDLAVVRVLSEGVQS